jgi:hypothetical protein
MPREEDASRYVRRDVSAETGFNRLQNRDETYLSQPCPEHIEGLRPETDADFDQSRNW